MYQLKYRCTAENLICKKINVLKLVVSDIRVKGTKYKTCAICTGLVFCAFCGVVSLANSGNRLIKIFTVCLVDDFFYSNNYYMNETRRCPNLPHVRSYLTLAVSTFVQNP